MKTFVREFQGMTGTKNVFYNLMMLNFLIAFVGVKVVVNWLCDITGSRNFFVNTLAVVLTSCWLMGTTYLILNLNKI